MVEEMEELVFRPSIFAFTEGLLLIAASFLASALLLTTSFPPVVKLPSALVPAVVGVISIIVLYFRARAFTFKLSADKVVVEYRFFVSKVEELPLEMVTEVIADQTLVDRIFKIGNVRAFSFAGRELTLFGLRRFENVKDEILRRRDLKVKHRVQPTAL